MHISSRHLYPGEVRWGRLEAECRVEDQVVIVDCRHRVIFFSAASLAILWPVLVDEAAVAGRRLRGGSRAIMRFPQGLKIEWLGCRDIDQLS